MENEQVTRRAAQQLREAAGAVEAIMRTRGDVDGALRARADASRETADQLDKFPRLSQGTKDWNKGMAVAMRDYHPFRAGAPRHA